jgi:hypothetical protein
MYSKRLAATVAAGVLVMSGLVTGTANASTGWVAKNPSRILNANTVLLVGGNTSVETTNLGIPVQAGAVVSFRYQLRGGAQCAGGAPRVFVETQGVYTNSWDQNLPGGTQCGKDGLVTFTVPDNGRIGAAGVVYDNGGPGQVLVSDLRVNGQRVSFLGRPVVRVKADAPTVVQPECDAKTGKLVIPSDRGVTYKVRTATRDYRTVRAGEYDVRPGVYRVTAHAKPGVRLVGVDRWRLEVEAAEACPTPTPTPTATDEPTPDPTPTVEPTVEPEPTEEPEPTPTVTETRTNTQVIVINDTRVPDRVDTGFGGLAK